MKIRNLLTIITIGGLIISCGELDSIRVDITQGADYPARQIHLDFHTSEFVEGIGEEFHKEEFQEALQLAYVNSINLFAKGWHGWSYYDTEVGHRHPHLAFDLLAAQIEACREIGIETCIYFAAGHAESDAARRPEWQARDREGHPVVRKKLTATNPTDARPHGTWTYMAPVDAYLDHMTRQTEEICRKYSVDGFWYDGVYTHPVSYNRELLAEMKTKGLNPDNNHAVFLYGVAKWSTFMQNCRDIILKYHPSASVFFNGTTEIHNEKKNYELSIHRFNTKHDLEDLPTTSWGWYDKFPLRSKLFHNKGKPLVAMSGKFHEGWGEFGGFKHPDAMRYEAASMIAFGAGCNFGDQLHPSGKIDLETYRNIGTAYEYVKQIEAFGVGGRPISNLGMWFSGGIAADEGVTNMLLESKIDFEVIGIENDLHRFEVIILPSSTNLDEKAVKELEAYLSGGGKLLVLGSAALNAEKSEFLLPVGAAYEGPAETDIDYMLVEQDIGTELVQSPFLCNYPALRTKLSPGAQVLAQVYEPYFSRTHGKYFSHRNTPPKTKPEDHPAVIRNDNVVFFAHPIDRIYFEFGARVHRDVFINALQLLYDEPMLEISGMPSSARVSLLHQPQFNRYVAHLLYVTPIKRGRVHVIEDLVPIYDVEVLLNVPERLARIYTVPQGQMLKPQQMERITLPKVEMHQAVVFEYQ